MTEVLLPPPGSRVAVFGAGAVGMSALMGLRLTGADQITAVDVHPARLALARKFSATDVIYTAAGDVSERIAALTCGAGVDGSIETSGNLGALRAAIGSLAAAGTCVVVGVPALGARGDFDVIDLVARGLRVVGTNQGDANPRVSIPRLVELYRRGRLPVEEVVTSFPFNEIDEAARASLDGTVIKPVLHMI